MATRLLLIEDDDIVAGQVVKVMMDRGYELDRAENLQRAQELTKSASYDVLVIDRMLPGGDGIDFVRALRARDDLTPILVLTALGGVDDRVAGLKSGADDYLVKPFSIEELEARVEALLRRATATTARVAIGDLVLDRLARTVCRGAMQITLMPRQFQLLEMLMVSSPSVVTRRLLLEEVWGFRFDPGTNLVESHVSRVRSKIDRGGDPPLIHTVRGEGYVALAR